ncbi:MAG: LysR family transcriptional regulator [Anaerolineae bacterium]
MTFCTVARVESFTNAAASLGYVQSSVTAQIQALEAELGVRLFDRLGKKIALTSEGRRFLTYAENMLELAEQAKQSIADSSVVSGTVTISASETMCAYRLPDVLERFHALYPQVRLMFRPMNVFSLRGAVFDGTVDVGFSLDEPIQLNSLIVHQLSIEPIVIVAPPSHRLARCPIVHPRDLTGEQILLTEIGCAYRNMFERVMSNHGVYVDNNLEFHSIEAIKRCVMAGMGISLIPRVTAAREIDEGKLVVLPWFDPEFHVISQMYWHKDRWMSPALDAFLQVVRSTLMCATEQPPEQTQQDQDDQLLAG